MCGAKTLGYRAKHRKLQPSPFVPKRNHLVKGWEVGSLIYFYESNKHSNNSLGWFVYQPEMTGVEDEAPRGHVTSSCDHGHIVCPLPQSVIIHQVIIIAFY